MNATGSIRPALLPSRVHPRRPGVIGGGRQDAVAAELLIDRLQIAGADGDVGLRIEQLARADVAGNVEHLHRMLRGARHHLHQAGSANRRLCLRIPCALLTRYRHRIAGGDPLSSVARRNSCGRATGKRSSGDPTACRRWSPARSDRPILFKGVTRQRLLFRPAAAGDVGAPLAAGGCPYSSTSARAPGRLPARQSATRAACRHRHHHRISGIQLLRRHHRIEAAFGHQVTQYLPPSARFLRPSVDWRASSATHPCCATLPAGAPAVATPCRSPLPSAMRTRRSSSEGERLRRIT